MDSNVTLEYFASLIQLWAGVCLLFFYETLLKRSPFDNLIVEFDELYQEFLYRYTAELGNLEKSTSSNIFWNDYVLPSIKNMAALTFFYCIVILVFIGLNHYGGVYNGALFIMNSFIIPYTILCGACPGFRIFHTYITPIIYIIFVLIIAVSFFIFYDYIYPVLLEYDFDFIQCFSNTLHTCYTLIACFAGLVMVLVRLFREYVLVTITKKRLTKLSDRFEIYSDVRMNYKHLEDLPYDIKAKFTTKAAQDFLKNGQVTNESVNKYITEEIQEEYKSFVHWSKPLSERMYIWVDKNVFAFFRKH